MFGIDDAIIASVGGSLVSGIFNSSSAAENRSFQAQQSATSYQRAVKDLKAAGLNPMLAYGNGGASTPSGSTAAPVNVGDFGYSTSVQAKLVRAQIEAQEAQAMDARAGAQLKVDQAAQVRTTTAAQAQAIDAGQLGIERLNAERPYWSANAYNANQMSGEQLNQIRSSIAQIEQSIKTGKASESQIRVLADNLRLDQKEKEAFSKLWSDMGEGGAGAKTGLQLLMMLKSIFGK